MRVLVQHARIARELVRIGVIRKSQFRMEFLFQVVMDCVWYGTFIVSFEVLFTQAETFAGWTHDMMRVFLGFVFVSDAFMMAWLGQTWRFARDLKDGKLDTVRVRPASPVFLYFFQQFSLEAVVNMAVAMAYLGHAMARAGCFEAPSIVLTLPLAMALSWWARVTTNVAFTIIELHAVGSDLANFLHRFLGAWNEQPLDVYTMRMKLLLLHVIPVGAMTWLPASMVLGRLAPWEVVFHSAWQVAFGLGVFALWKRSFRRYESALG